MGDYIRDWEGIEKGNNHYVCIPSVYDNGTGSHSHATKEELLNQIDSEIEWFKKLKKEVIEGRFE